MNDCAAAQELKDLTSSGIFKVYISATCNTLKKALKKEIKVPLGTLIEEGVYFSVVWLLY